MENIKRIRLLSENQIADLYAKPEFNHVEQQLYFTLNDQEIKVLNNYVNKKSKIYFLLQLGYFKAKQRFFKFNFEDVINDCNYIIQNIICVDKTILTGCLSRIIIKEQKNDILALFNYEDWSSKKEVKTVNKISEFLQYHPKIHSVLRQLLDYFANRKIIIPSYRKLQDMFTSAFSFEHNRLSNIMLLLPNNIKEELTLLINSINGITDLNIIRADQKNFQYTSVKNEIKKVEKIINLYEFSKEFIPKLKFSKNAIHYYAELAEQYAGFRLRQVNKPLQWLQVICFINYRYKQIMDNLIISFMYHIKSMMNASKEYADNALKEYSARMMVELPKLVDFLKWFPDKDKNLTHEEINSEAYKILPQEQFLHLAEFLTGNVFDKTAAKLEFYSKSSRTLSLYLRPILLAVSFEHYKENSKISTLLTMIKNHYQSGKKPAAFKLQDDFGFTIPINMIKYLKKNENDKFIDPYLFEFYVYEKMHHHLDKGLLFCNESVSYCDIEQDLIDDSLVDDIEKISEKFGYSKIPIYCDKRLDDALVELNNTWEKVTKNIELNNNIGFIVNETNTEEPDWSLLYDNKEELDDAFFRMLPKVSIIDMMMYIGDLSAMWNEFIHMKDRYTNRERNKPLELIINACILSEAFGFGTNKMAEMSDINAKSLFYRKIHKQILLKN